MGKIVETRKLYKEKIDTITKTENNWLDFLDCSSWHFKYNFVDKVLIYAQRPDAKACGEMENDWNRKCKRWVNKDANGIFVLSKDENSLYPFRLVFDVSDTHNNKGTEYKLWSVKQEYEEKIIETLETTFGGECESEELSEHIISTAHNMVVDNIQDYLSSIYENKKGTDLENLPDNEIEQIITLTVWASVSYMMMTRCGINAREKINIQEFTFIKNFSNDRIVTAIGTAISEIAEVGIKEIAKTVINLQKEEKIKNHTFVKNEKSEYDTNKEIDKGGIEYGENRIHESRRLQHTKSSNGERENTKWEIRKNEATLPKGKQESRLFDIIDEQRLEQRINTDSKESNRNDKSDNREISKTGWSNRGNESTRSNEMDRTNEQLQIDGRRTSDKRTNLQLEQNNINIWNDNSNILKFNDNETIEKIINNAPDIIKNKENIENYFKFHDDIKRIEYIVKTLGNAYTEYEIDNNQRVGYKAYENGLLLWKGKYLSRTEECFKSWNEISELFITNILYKENEDIVNELPTEEEQKQSIAEEEKSSVFSFSQEMIDTVLKHGNSVENGKFRIYEYLTRGLSSTENAEFLKQEYGIGGVSADSNGVLEDYNAKGIKLSIDYKENAPTLLLTWKQVEKRIRELITANRYFNAQEQDEYFDWLDANEIIPNNAEEPVKNEDYKLAERLHNYIMDYDIVSYHNNFSLDNTTEQNIEFLQADINDESNIQEYIDFLKESCKDLDNNDKMSIEAKQLINELENKLPNYEFISGDIVYIGTDEYEIRTIDNNRVTLIDTSFPLLTKEMERDEFINKVKENPANDKLRTGKRIIDTVQEENINTIEDTKELENTKNSEIEEIKQVDSKEEKNEILRPNIKRKRRNKIEYFDLYPDIPMSDRNNFKIQNNDLGVGGKKEKYQNNINAIKVLKKCEDEKRYATTEEQEILVKYVGWGGLQEAFDSRNDSWHKEYNELKSLLTEKEYADARKSTVTAFYTPPVVIRSIYRALENMGLEKGNILEPSCRYR